MSSLRLALSLLMLAAVPLASSAAKLFESPATVKKVEDLVPASATALTRQGVLSGNFAQKKTLSDLPKPLLSSGDFLFARDRGVIWHVAKPFDSEFVLTPREMITREAGSERRTPASEQPGLKIATQLFTALFTLDLAALENEFILYASGSASAWQLGLKPRHAAMASSFAEAVIAGGEQVQTITLVDGQGDKTEMTLSAVQARASLSAADAKRFP